MSKRITPTDPIVQQLGKTEILGWCMIGSNGLPHLSLSDVHVIWLPNTALGTRAPCPMVVGQDVFTDMFWAPW